MCSNKEIACGFVRQNKYEVASFWTALGEELNSAGPPTKSVFEWKKVWGDQKRYVRKKASQNLIHSRGTGGGPNKQMPLTKSEETIFQLIGAKEAVEGIDGANVFGRSAEVECIEDCSEILIETPTAEIKEPTKRKLQDDTPRTSITTSPFPKVQKITASSAIEKELENQKKLCMTISDVSVQMKENHTETMGQIKRIYRALEKANDLRKEALKEQQRHNIAMEELFKLKIEKKMEINQKLVELEELKMGLG